MAHHSPQSTPRNVWPSLVDLFAPSLIRPRLKPRVVSVGRWVYKHHPWAICDCYHRLLKNFAHTEVEHLTPLQFRTPPTIQLGESDSSRKRWQSSGYNLCFSIEKSMVLMIYGFSYFLHIHECVVAISPANDEKKNIVMKNTFQRRFSTFRKFIKDPHTGPTYIGPVCLYLNPLLRGLIMMMTDHEYTHTVSQSEILGIHVHYKL